jgi:hypothetical protein
MPTPPTPTSFNFSDTNPAAPAGRVNGKWLASAPYPLVVLVNNVPVTMQFRDFSVDLPDVGSGSVIGFVMNSGATGTNVGAMMIAPHAGAITKVKLVTKASDAAIDLTFDIKQNGVSIFTAPLTVAHGTASGTLTTFAGVLTSSPLAIAADDIFTIDITSGAATWQFTVQIE